MSGSTGAGDVKNLAAMYTTATGTDTGSTISPASATPDSDNSFPHYPKQRVLHKDGYAQRATFLEAVTPAVQTLVLVLQKHLPEGDLTPAELQVLHSLERWLGRIVVEKSLNIADPPSP